MSMVAAWKIHQWTKNAPTKFDEDPEFHDNYADQEVADHNRAALFKHATPMDEEYSYEVRRGRSFDEDPEFHDNRRLNALSEWY